MKTTSLISSGHRRNGGYALIMVMVLSAVSLLTLTGALSWVSTTVNLSNRNSRFIEAQYAAESATEIVLARLIRDFQSGGQAQVDANVSAYSSMLPSTAQNAYWGRFSFNNATGTLNQTFVTRTSANNSTNTAVQLNAQFFGLYGYGSTYRIASNARATNVSQIVVGTAQQDIQIATIPLFQFAIFYNNYMDLNPGTTMTVNGRVHANGPIYTGSSTLTFNGQVTSTSVNIATREPHDPTYSASLSTPSYSPPFATNLPTLTVPIGTNNSPTAVHAVIEVPPASEDPNSAMGQQRFYNKASLLILVTNNAVTVSLRNPNNWTNMTNIVWGSVSNFISTNKTFTDLREGKTVRTTEIDMGKYKNFLWTNNVVTNWYGQTNPPNILFVADSRTVTSSQMDAVRLTNGVSLQTNGLTLATPNPIYVEGNYNCPTAGDLGTTNTSHGVVPASINSDALTILSGAWSDGNSGAALTTRTPINITINAAIMTGNVPWTNGMANYYSGGANNLCRLLENWSSGTSTTLNTSLICMYSSTIATGQFQQSGGYYNIPTRNFSFDPNFYNAGRLPPGTPQIRGVIRVKWDAPPPGSTVYVSQ